MSLLKTKPQEDRKARIEDALASKKEKELKERLEIQPKTTDELIDETLTELHRQLRPLLSISKQRDFKDEELDRFLKLNHAILAIHRQLTPQTPQAPGNDPQYSPKELMRAAHKNT